MKKDQKLISKLLSGKAASRYIGKQVAILEGKIYLLPESDKAANELITKLIQNHPKSTPTITFVPKTGTYILITQK